MALAGFNKLFKLSLPIVPKYNFPINSIIKIKYYNYDNPPEVIGRRLIEMPGYVYKSRHNEVTEIIAKWNGYNNDNISLTYIPEKGYNFQHLSINYRLVLEIEELTVQSISYEELRDKRNNYLRVTLINNTTVIGYLDNYYQFHVGTKTLHLLGIVFKIDIIDITVPDNINIVDNSISEITYISDKGELITKTLYIKDLGNNISFIPQSKFILNKLAYKNKTLHKKLIYNAEVVRTASKLVDGEFIVQYLDGNTIKTVSKSFWTLNFFPSYYVNDKLLLYIVPPLILSVS